MQAIHGSRADPLLTAVKEHCVAVRILNQRCQMAHNEFDVVTAVCDYHNSAALRECQPLSHILLYPTCVGCNLLPHRHHGLLGDTTDLAVGLGTFSLIVYVACHRSARTVTGWLITGNEDH